MFIIECLQQRKYCISYYSSVSNLSADFLSVVTMFSRSCVTDVYATLVFIHDAYICDLEQFNNFPQAENVYYRDNRSIIYIDRMAIIKQMVNNQVNQYIITNIVFLTFRVHLRSALSHQNFKTQKEQKKKLKNT